MSALGQYRTLPVTKALDFGFYLDAGELLGEVLLPRRYAPPGLKIGDSLEVFLYMDSEDRPIATTERAKASVGEFALLECVGVSGVGAFLDWGLSKDVMVPFAEQPRRMEPGKHYLVYLYLDKHDGRITASARLDRFLKEDQPHRFRNGDTVGLTIASTSDLGTKVIINHSHWGMLHHADMEEGLRFGQQLPGVIKRVRPDGKIDVRLKTVKHVLDEQAQRIEAWLARNGGISDINDRASPEEIKARFGMSKAAFKKAVGMLMRAGRITLAEPGIRLLAPGEKGARPSQTSPSRTSPSKASPSKASSRTSPSKASPSRTSPSRVASPRTATSKASPARTTRPQLSQPAAREEKRSATLSASRKAPASQIQADSPWKKKNTRDVRITSEPVELFKLLKFEGLTGSGGEAKKMVEDGLVLVNGKVETQKRKKLQDGDTVTYGTDTLRLVKE